MENCDFCDRPYRMADRRVVALPRPSDPTELCAVMWGCGECPNSAELPTAVEVIRAVEEGREVEGRRYLFVSV